MKYVIIAVISIIIVVGLFFAVSDSTPQDAPSSTTPTITYSSITTDVAAGAVLYDVRTPEEFAESHVSAATNFSLLDIEAGKFPAVPKDTKIYVYCRSGNRSAQATTLLTRAGFINVIDLGGVDDMEQLGATFTKE